MMVWKHLLWLIAVLSVSLIRSSTAQFSDDVDAKPSGVCSVQRATSRTIQKTLTGYTIKRMSATGECSEFWHHCTKYYSSVVPVTRLVSYLVTHYHLDETCCSGYSGSAPDCMPICKIRCQNGGNCTAPGVCSCPSGWIGAYCEIALCTAPCENGGLCSAPDFCSCPPLWIGPQCETAVCIPDCQNGGECVAPGMCKCSAGWIGDRCEKGFCTQPCQNGGRCSAPDFCSCPPSWTGPQCEAAICKPECVNGGVCRAPGNCSCPTGWNGTYCQEGICIPPCQNGGRCSEPEACLCLPSWTGLQCETAICEPRCQNDGECVSPGVCLCPSEWTGTHCEEALVPLSPSDPSAERMSATAIKVNLPILNNYITLAVGNYCHTEDSTLNFTVNDIVGPKFIVDGIDPRDMVCVLVVTRIGGKVKNFSESISLYMNTPIQLQLQSSSLGDCEQMRQDLTLAIETKIASGISEVGHFSYPAEYVAQGQSLCTLSQGKVLFKATLVSTDFINSTNLADLLFYWRWNNSKPEVVVVGKHFIVESVSCTGDQFGPQTVQCKDPDIPSGRPPEFQSYTAGNIGVISSISTICGVSVFCGICCICRRRK